MLDVIHTDSRRIGYVYLDNSERRILSLQSVRSNFVRGTTTTVTRVKDTLEIANTVSFIVLSVSLSRECNFLSEKNLVFFSTRVEKKKIIPT